MHAPSRTTKPVRPRRRASVRHTRLGGHDESAVVAGLPNVETRRTRTDEGKVRTFHEAHHVPDTQPTRLIEPAPVAWSGKDWFRMTAGILISLLLLYVAFQSLAQLGPPPGRTVDYSPTQRSASDSQTTKVATHGPTATDSSPSLTEGTVSSTPVEPRSVSRNDSLESPRDDTTLAHDELLPVNEIAGQAASEETPFRFVDSPAQNENSSEPSSQTLSELAEYPATGFPAPGSESNALRLAQRPNQSPTFSSDTKAFPSDRSNSETPVLAKEPLSRDSSLLNEPTHPTSRPMLEMTNPPSGTQGETRLQGTIEKFPINQ